MALDGNRAGRRVIAPCGGARLRILIAVNGATAEGVVKVTAIRRRVARQALWQVMIYPVRARHSANAAVRLCL